MDNMKLLQPPKPPRGWSGVLRSSRPGLGADWPCKLRVQWVWQGSGGGGSSCFGDPGKLFLLTCAVCFQGHSFILWRCLKALDRMWKRKGMRKQSWVNSLSHFHRDLKQSFMAGEAGVDCYLCRVGTCIVAVLCFFQTTKRISVFSLIAVTHLGFCSVCNSRRVSVCKGRLCRDGSRDVSLLLVRLRWSLSEEVRVCV